MPFELRPFPVPSLDTNSDYIQQGWRNSVLPTAQRMGIPMVFPKVNPLPRTHLAFEGYQYAKERGKEKEYNERIMKAFYGEGQDIGNVDVLTQLAAEVDLPAAEFRSILEQRTYQEAHQAALKHAYEEANITAVPTFVIGTQRLAGLYSQEALESIIVEELQKLGMSS